MEEDVQEWAEGRLGSGEQRWEKSAQSDVPRRVQSREVGQRRRRVFICLAHVTQTRPTRARVPDVRPRSALLRAV